jgi:hypothetical protein
MKKLLLLFSAILISACSHTIVKDTTFKYQCSNGKNLYVNYMDNGVIKLQLDTESIYIMDRMYSILSETNIYTGNNVAFISENKKKIFVKKGIIEAICHTK